MMVQTRMAHCHGGGTKHLQSTNSHSILPTYPRPHPTDALHGSEEHPVYNPPRSRKLLHQQHRFCSKHQYLYHHFKQRMKYNNNSWSEQPILHEYKYKHMAYLSPVLSILPPVDCYHNHLATTSMPIQSLDRRRN